MDEILGWTVGEIIGGGIGLVVILSVFIEITPIKVNPVSAILSWVGNKTTKAVSGQITCLAKEVKRLGQKVDDLEYAADMRNAVACRVRILRFGDECRAGSEHSKEMFDQILGDVSVYEHYCAEHPEFANNKTELTSQHIKKLYLDRLEKNDFA